MSILPTPSAHENHSQLSDHPISIPRDVTAPQPRLSIAPAPGRMELLPASKVVKEWAFAIFVGCITVFGFQKDATIVFIDDNALKAAMTACLTSGISLLLAFVYDSWLKREAVRTLSIVVHAIACICLSLSCVAFSAFIGCVAWMTAPHIFIAFCIACSLIVGTVVLTLLRDLASSRVPRHSSVHELEGRDIEAQGDQRV